MNENSATTIYSAKQVKQWKTTEKLLFGLTITVLFASHV